MASERITQESGDELLKVCFVSHSSGLRGAERALLEAIEALRAYPVHPHVFAPSHGPFVDKLEAMGVDYSLCPLLPWVTTRRTGWKGFAKFLLAIPLTCYLVLQLRKQECQLVYSNTLAIAMGAWASSLIKIPHIWHIHEFGYEDHGFEFDPGERVARWFFKQYGGFFVFSSYSVAERFFQFLGYNALHQKSKTIYQSVTMPSTDRLEKNQPMSSVKHTLVLVGALHRGKGQTDAILAVKELRKRGLEPNLVIVGSGSFRDVLVGMVNELGVDSNVRFTGFVENVSDIYRCADIVLVCSRKEAFGRVAIEGMLSGKPVIAANAGGLKELIQQDEVTGILYQQGDPIDLANKIEFLVKNRELAAKIAQRGFVWANEHFTKERYGKELYEVIKAWLSRNREKR